MPLRRFWRAWLALQVSHRGGTYSIERVLALDEYTTNTSLCSVVFLCLCTPLPMIVLALCQELVPLQDPLDGWLANYGFWIRLLIMCGVIANAITLQAKFLVDGVRISVRQLVLISVCGAVGGILVPILVAAFVSFPIPFTVVTMCPPYFVLLATSFRLVVGSDGFRDVLANREQLWRLVAFVSSQVALVIIYPVYQTVFEAAAHTKWQLFIVLLLPLIKLATKYLVTLTVAHVEDMMPEAVIVTVDFFNAMYLATSMQSATSTTTVVAIMVIDLSQTVVGLISLHRRTASILSRVHEALVVPEHDRASLGLLSSVCLLCRSAEKFERQTLDGVRIHSPLEHRLTAESRNLLERLSQRKFAVPPARVSIRDISSLNAIITTPSARQATSRGIRKLLCKYADRSTITPITNVQLVAASSIHRIHQASRVAKDHTEMSELLREALAALFTSECLVLTEFLESIIPMFYGIYMVVMVNLPSAQYHIELVGVTRDNVGPTVRTVFVYALLEFVSFVVLAIIMRRNCGMRALSHLAFVLRTQMQLVLSKMTLWMVVTLAFRVVHFGTAI